MSRITTRTDKFCDTEAAVSAELYLPLNFFKPEIDRSVCSVDLTVMAPTRALAKSYMRKAIKKLIETLQEELK